MLTLLALSTAALIATQEPYSDVVLYPDRIEFVELDGATLTREAFYLPFAVDGDDPPVPTPLDECVASAIATCGVHNVAWLRFSNGPNGVTCEFGCKDGTGTGG